MLRDLLLWLRFRRLNGSAVGIGDDGDELFGLGDARVSPLGITGRIDGRPMFVQWPRVGILEWGPHVEGLVTRREAEAGDEDERETARFHAFLRASMRAAGKPAIPPEEIERVMAEERDTPC